VALGFAEFMAVFGNFMALNELELCFFGVEFEYGFGKL
jgi:hypothetical protein